MGFECAFEKVKKYNDDISVETISNINTYVGYINNSWAKENNISWDSYFNNNKEIDSENEIFNPEEYKDEIEFYKSFYEQYEGITKTVRFWGSTGKYFDEWFRYRLNMKDNESIAKQFLTQDILIDALNYCVNELHCMRFKPVIVNRSFNEDEETSTITSVPCDGVEVKDSDENIKRVYANDLEYSDLFVKETDFDTDRHNVFVSLLTTIASMLQDVDFETESIMYTSGW